jgi:hypothetical protein
MNIFKIPLYLNHLVKMTAQLESNLTSVERIKEYCHTPREVNTYKN